MRQLSGSKTRLLVMLFAITALTISAVACGDSGGSGSDADEIIQKINPTDRIYTIDDLTAIGFKDSKSYDVSELPGAVEVHYGLYGANTNSKNEYEARFFASHADAVALGVEYVEEAIGEDAILLKSDQRWDEGIRERRSCAGGTGHQVGTCDNPKYFDYIIVGNMILMCPGKDSINSLEACAELMDVVK